MNIGHHDTREKIIVVAEIGNNHEGDFSVAQLLVREAARCGADAVKVQVFKTELYVGRKDEARFARLKAFELTPEQFTELAQLASSLGLAFLATPFDLVSAQWLPQIASAIKIASGDNTFYPLLSCVARSGLPVILSTGLLNWDSLAEVVGAIRGYWRDLGRSGELALLQCASAYPVPPEDVNLQVINELRARYPDTVIGFSDHVEGIEAAVLAAGLGARIVEKHFTIDKHYSDFRDHQLSADPSEMSALVERVRAVETMLGDGEKRIVPSERVNETAIRRSIVAKRDLRCGETLTADDITWLRPGGGIAPGKEALVVGRPLLRDVPCGDQLNEDDIAGTK